MTAGRGANAGHTGGAECHSTIPPFQLPLCDYNLENFSKSRVNMNG